MSLVNYRSSHIHSIEECCGGMTKEEVCNAHQTVIIAKTLTFCFRMYLILK
jgi:hypothetical protein